MLDVTWEAPGGAPVAWFKDPPVLLGSGRRLFDLPGNRPGRDLTPPMAAR